MNEYPMNIQDTIKQELIDNINSMIDHDITFVGVLLDLANNRLAKYIEHSKTKTDNRVLNALHDCFCYNSALKKNTTSMESAMLMANVVYLLNIDGYCTNNCSEVKRLTRRFCDLYFPERNLEYERKSGNDFSKLYDWWVGETNGQ